MNRDYTDRIGQENATGSLVRFRLDDSGNTKLLLVKAIKDTTGFGLKDSKDFIDLCNDGSATFSKRMTRQEVDEFRRRLSECGGIKYELDDRQSSRNRKLINLGLFEKNDIIDEISKDASHKLIMMSGDVNSIQDFISSLFTHVDEDTLLKIFNSQNEGSL
jgi:hypothetical protein